jgi:hypothetical protein
MAASTNYDQIPVFHNSQTQGSSVLPPAGFCHFVQGAGVDAISATTKYLANPGENHAAAQIKLFGPAPFACTIGYLAVSCETAPGGSDTSIFTVQKSVDKGANWTDTALTATVVAAGTTAYDTTHFVAIAKGDMLAIKEVASGSTGAKCSAAFFVMP